jgi:hypothetical protein
VPSPVRLVAAVAAKAVPPTVKVVALSITST